MVKLKQNIKTIIFGTDTKAGKLFDEILIATILLSIITVCIESVSTYREQYGNILYTAEWVFTIIVFFLFLLGNGNSWHQFTLLARSA